MNIKEWISNNLLDVIWCTDNLFEIPEFGTFLLIREKEKMFNEDFLPCLDDDEIDLWNEYDYFCYKFGEKFYYYHKDKDKAELNVLKYIGKTIEDNNFIVIPYLGVHGKYEIGNGTRDYNDWCAKAKFIGVKTLGLTERNTLAGAYHFNSICKKNDIKPIFGYECDVKQSNTIKYTIKLYVQNKIGWSNLLSLHKINVCDNANFITEEDLFKYSDGLTIVICTSTKVGDYLKNIVSLKPYYQVDAVEWKSQTKEKEWLDNIREYLYNWLDIFPPVLITDSYYLDSEDAISKKTVNKIINTGFHSDSIDQYFKTFNDIYNQIEVLFADTELFDIFIDECIINLEAIENNCNFEVKREGMFLPQYELTEEEIKKYGDSTEMFYALVGEGMKKFVYDRLPQSEWDVYSDRLQREIKLLEAANLFDYFLILWDSIRFADTIGCMRSVGRGSAAGSIVSWLLQITLLDPIKNNLLFERFLTLGRVGLESKKELITEAVIDNTEKIELELDNGDKMILHQDSVLMVNRNGISVEVNVNELLEEDEILM